MAVLSLLVAQALFLFAELNVCEQGQSQQNEEVHFELELFRIRFLKLVQLLDDPIVAEKLLVEVGFKQQDLLKRRAAIDHVAECPQHLLDLALVENDPIGGEEALQDLDEIQIGIFGVESIDYDFLGILLEYSRRRSLHLQLEEHSDLMM